MRSSSIWVPLFITAGAAVTIGVLAQRHVRSSSKTEERRREGPASESAPDISVAKPVVAEVSAPHRSLAFDTEPPSEASVEITPPESVTPRGEAYDAVSADDLGAEWLARATESLPIHAAAERRGEYDELTTLDLLDEDTSPFSDLTFEPDSKLGPDSMLGAKLESEAVLELEAELEAKALQESPALRADPNPEDLEAHLDPPRPPPRVFDVSDLPEERDFPASDRRG